MIEKLSFLKNKTLTFITIGVVALFNCLTYSLKWSKNGFDFIEFVVFFALIILLTVLFISIYLKNNKGILISTSAYLFYIVIKCFVENATMLDFYSKAKVGVSQVCCTLFGVLAALTLLISFILFLINAFFSSSKFSRKTNIIVCLLGFVFGIVAFGLYFTFPEIEPSYVCSFLGLSVFCLSDIVLSFNIEN